MTVDLHSAVRTAVDAQRERSRYHLNMGWNVLDTGFNLRGLS